MGRLGAVAPNTNVGGRLGRLSNTSQPTTQKNSFLSDSGKKAFTLPDFLGGGAYFADTGVKEEHSTFGGVKTKTGYQRDDIVPVSLGGVNTSAKNIKLIPEKVANKLDDYEIQLAKDVKAGRIGQREAQVKILGAKQKAQDEMDGISTSVIKNIPSALKETVGGFLKGLASPFVRAGVAEYNALNTTLDLIQGKTEQASQDISKTRKVPLYGEAEPMFTGQESFGEGTKKMAGNALEIAPYFLALPESKLVGLSLKEIGAKSLADLTKKDLGKFVINYGKKIGISAGTIGPLFGLGQSLQENASPADTFKNILKSTLTIAALETVMSPIVGIKGSKVEKVKLPKENIKVPSKDIGTIKSSADPSITYIPKKSLGLDTNGEMVLARTEINYKTGEKKIFYSTALDKHPELKIKVLDHEHGHIIDKQLTGDKGNLSAMLPAYEANKTVLDASLDDFSKTQGKSNAQISLELQKDIATLAKGSNQAETFANAISEYKANPKIAREKAPTLSALLEFKADPNLEIKPTTASDLVAEAIVEKVKVAEASKNVEPIKSTLPPKLKTKSKLISSTGFKTGKGVETKPFNPKTINAPEEVQQLFETLGGKDQFKGQRISKSNEDIRDLARMTGLTEDQLINAKPGSIANAETITKARQLVLDKAQDLSNYIKGIDRDTATPEQLKIFKEKLTKLISMQKAVAGLRTEASNVFRSLGIEIMPGENASYAELLGEIKRLDKDAAGDLSLFSQKTAKELSLTTKQKVGQGALSTWYSVILSGPKTTARNITSTTANILTDLVSKAGNPKTIKEIPTSVVGMLKGFAKAWPEAKAVFKGEKQAIGKFGEFGDIKPEVFTGKFRTYGKIVESVGRFLNAQDTLMKGGAVGMEKASLKAQGLEIENAVSKAITDYYGETTVYHGLPKGRVIEGVRASAQTLRKYIPESKIIVPFVNTVANVLDRQFDYLPVVSYLRLSNETLGRQADKIIKDYSLKATDKSFIVQRLRDQQIGRAVLGTAISSATIVIAKNGQISGSGPTNVAEKEQLITTGWRPDSIKIGNYWIPYTNLGPLAGILSMAGNIHDKTVYDKAPNKTLLDLLGKGMVGWTQSELRQSFLSGVANLFEAVTGGVAPDKYLKNLVSGLAPIPALYTQTYQMTHPKQYETKTIAESLRLKLGLTGGLEPKLNQFGEQKKSDLIAGLSWSKIKDDQVIEFLKGSDLTVSVPSKTTLYAVPDSEEKRQMTAKEYRNYIENSGQSIYNEINNNLDFLYGLEPDEQKKEIDRIVREARKQAKDEILSE